MDELIEKIPGYAKRLRDSGLDLYYHCHDFEFQVFDRVTTMERILNETDVKIELDLFWAAKGGCDLKKFIEENHERILYFHLKDSREGKPCAVGQGELDWQYYIREAMNLVHTDIIVEDDIQLPDGITSICNSMQSINTFFRSLHLPESMVKCDR